MVLQPIARRLADSLRQYFAALGDMIAQIASAAATIPATAYPSD
jgi:hypothetical protein